MILASITKAWPFTKRHILPAVTTVSVAIVIVPAYLSRTSPVEFLGFKLKEQAVHQGDKLGLVYAYRVLKHCDSEMHLAMYDHTEEVRHYVGPLSESIDQPEDNGPEIFSGVTKYIGVPVHAAEGSGSLQGYAVFHCNAFHNIWPITIRIPSQEFSILPRKIEPRLEDKLDQIEKKLDSIPSEVLEPPFRSNPLPPVDVQRDKSGGSEEVLPPIPRKAPKGPTRVVRKKDRVKLENRTTASAAATDSKFDTDANTDTKIPPMPKEELPNWIKWMAKQ